MIADDPTPIHDDPPQASPLWPLVLILGDIARRVEHEETNDRVAS